MNLSGTDGGSIPWEDRVPEGFGARTVGGVMVAEEVQAMVGGVADRPDEFGCEVLCPHHTVGS